MDDEGKDVPVGQPGEVIVKAPIVTKGYHKNPEANKEAFTDGWFRTGDIALFKDGMFYIVDRKKVRSFRPGKPEPCEMQKPSAALTRHRNSSSTKASKSRPRSWRRCSCPIHSSWTRR